MHEAPANPVAADRLPDFCSLPILFALVLVAALTVAVMALAPGAGFAAADFSAGIAFAVWLALCNGVALCKLRPWLLRLPGVATFAGVWLAILVLVAVASFVIGWLDHALHMALTPASTLRFVTSNVTISALIGAALLRYFYVVAQWQARQAAAARAQVEALQARIRPHFLFNSMNTVAALVRIDPAAAETCIENLSALFRAALTQQGPSTLGSELALVERYLAIEQLRLGARLTVQRQLHQVPEAFAVPRLLLQPLVENAIVHGIAPRRDGGQLRLVVRGQAEGVAIGIDNPLAPGHDTRGSGHGLDNVRQRLHYHFGPAARLHVHIRADRFQVHLWIPATEKVHAHPRR